MKFFLFSLMHSTCGGVSNIVVYSSLGGISYAMQ